MAVEVERLLVTLEARIGDYNKNLMAAQAQTNRQLAVMEGRFAQWSGRLKNSASGAAAGIGTVFAGIGAALGTQAVVEYANAWTRLTRSIDGSARVFGVGLKSAEALTDLANDSRVDVEAYSKLYIRTTAAIRDYGFEAGTAEKVTSTLAKALKLGGAAASEQTSVLLQFSQALQKGKLDGDEFRTVMENAGVVQELLAKRLNVSKGAIVQMAAAGKLQIKDLVGAMVDGGDQVDRIFRQMPQTIDEAFAVLRNNVIQFLGQADQATGASAAISAGIVTISQNLGAVAVAAGAILGSATLRMAAFAAATVSVANPLTLIAAAIGGLATAYGVFGDDVKVTGDGIVSLKDSLNAFLQIASEGASSGVSGLMDALTAIKAEAEASGFTFDNLAQSVMTSGTAIASVAKSIDEKLGGIGSKIANAFFAANAELARMLGITAALDGAVGVVGRIADRAQSIALARGIEGANLGAGLADALAGKKTGPQNLPGPTAEKGKRSHFERETDQIKKRTEALRAEIATIGQSTFAQDKAKASAELRFAAAQTAAKEGRKVTVEEIAAIDQLSTAYAGAQAQAAFFAKLQGERDNARNLTDEIALIGLQGQELAHAKIQQQLLNEAKQAGIDLTPALREQIDAIAEQNSALAQQLSILNDVRDQSADALKSFISDMREGKSASEALSNSLDRIADKLVDMAVDGLVESALGGVLGGAGGGLLGSLFSGGATTTGWGATVTPFAKGGIAANGKPVNLPRFARGGVSKSAAIFGEAGPEAAVPLPDGRRIPVDLRMPTIPTAAAGSSAPVVNFAPVFHTQGGQAGADAIKADVMPQLKALVKQEIVQVFDRDPRFAKSGI